MARIVAKKLEQTVSSATTGLKRSSMSPMSENEPQRKIMRQSTDEESRLCSLTGDSLAADVAALLEHIFNSIDEHDVATTADCAPMELTDQSQDDGPASMAAVQVMAALLDFVDSATC